ncbi:hypothetical protein Cme02nite_20580 [Catellatospora methionotrophica]|uniref:DUF4034 domain-containing protein n=1 Tax=Catellatospora methionotrophica TaxID=121620 RepID=A0A8J3PDP5_9ACTN|nr:hypothetical protein [Catellatospora methionotrophica]GIG13726.1 hypothetical protein Cme02nite_20580 [Catellatospora methionotrophica]
MTIISRPAPSALAHAAAFPEVADVRSWCRQGDWAALSGHFARLPTVDDAYFTARIVGDQPEADTFLPDVAQASPTDPLPRVLLAARAIGLAWQARTGARDVSRDRLDRMHAHLRRGEQLLIDVTARDPADGVAWALRLTNARGLELGQAEARRRYDRLARHHPHMHGAQAQLLQQLCPKWGGSWAAAFAFARTAAADAPEGGLHAGLLAQAHVERWRELRGGEQAAYFRRPDVVAELADAAARSVLHPSYRPVYGWVTTHNLFAAAFSLAGEHRRARVHFDALGDLADRFPWAYLGDPAEQFARHRARARKG